MPSATRVYRHPSPFRGEGGPPAKPVVGEGMRAGLCPHPPKPSAWAPPSPQLGEGICYRIARGPASTHIVRNDRVGDSMESWHGTTIIGVRKNNKAVIAGDGQVSLQST